jgi:hypothetical protein
LLKNNNNNTNSSNNNNNGNNDNKNNDCNILNFLNYNNEEKVNENNNNNKNNNEIFFSSKTVNACLINKKFSFGEFNEKKKIENKKLENIYSTSGSSSDNEILFKAKKMFDSINLTIQNNLNNDDNNNKEEEILINFLKTIDEATWLLINEWKNFYFLTSVRCCALVILNFSNFPIQILQINVKEGCHVELFGIDTSSTSKTLDSNNSGNNNNNTLLTRCGGFDEHARVLNANGGACCVFGYGFTPTIVNLQHVKIEIVTTAFSAVFATRKDRTEFRNVMSGFSVGFVEKTLSDCWGKYVILVT